VQLLEFLRVLKYSKIREPLVPIILKNLSELLVFMEEPMKNQWFYIAGYLIFSKSLTTMVTYISLFL